jgi:FAD binding domain/Flavin reductase like domain
VRHGARPWSAGGLRRPPAAHGRDRRSRGTRRRSGGPPRARRPPRAAPRTPPPRHRRDLPVRRQRPRRGPARGVRRVRGQRRRQVRPRRLDGLAARTAHLDGALAAIDCAIEDVHEAGDHLIVVGAVRELHDRRDHGPLLYFRGDHAAGAFHQPRRDSCEQNTSTTSWWSAARHPGERPRLHGRDGRRPRVGRRLPARRQRLRQLLRRPDAAEPNLAPLEKGPFYAVPVVPGDIGTKGGLVNDGDARVLRADGSAIEGLYATGNCSSAVTGETSPGPARPSAPP